MPALRRSVFLLLLAAAVCAESPESTKERLLRRTLSGARYRLFVPAAYDGKTELPLVLFLHGAAGRGRDNQRHLLDGNGMLVELFAGGEKEFPAFVLAPQTATTHDPETTFAVLDDVRNRYRVDPTRMYVAGQSLGGYGLIDLIGTRPQLFAAAVVIAASGRPEFREEPGRRSDLVLPRRARRRGPRRGRPPARGRREESGRDGPVHRVRRRGPRPGVARREGARARPLALRAAPDSRQVNAIRMAGSEKTA